MTDTPAAETFESALADLRLEEADTLLASADPDLRLAWQSRLDETRRAAGEEARRLVDHVMELARADRYGDLLEIGDDPRTERLLALLVPELRNNALVHLEAATTWRDLQASTSLRHMSRAREALDGFDPTLARSHLRRVDGQWLTGEQREELDAIWLRAEAATLEQEDLAKRAEQVLAEHRPGKRRAGCLTAALLGCAALLAALLR